MKRHWIGALVIVSVAALVLAEEPTSQPVRRPQDRPAREKLRELIEGGPRPEGLGKRPQMQELTDQEIQDGLKYVEQNAPNRYRFFEQLPESGPMRKRLAQAWGMRLRMLSRMKSDDPKLAEILEKQFQVQDEAFGLLHDAKAGLGDDELREKMRTKVAELVDLSLRERETRIDALKQKLQKESEKLETDKADRDQLIQRQLQRMRSEFQELNRGRLDRPLDGQRRGDADSDAFPSEGLLGDIPSLLVIDN